MTIIDKNKICSCKKIDCDYSKACHHFKPHYYETTYCNSNNGYCPKQCFEIPKFEIIIFKLLSNKTIDFNLDTSDNVCRDLCELWIKYLKNEQ